MRFLGNFEAKADAKGRVFLPSAFRKVLKDMGDERMVMRKDVFQACLVLYPESVWNRQMDFLRSKLSRWNKTHQQVFRQFVSEAEAVAFDDNGRFLIPKRIQQAEGMTGSVRFIGMGDTIEIWATGAAESAFMEQEKFGGVMEDIMKEQDPVITQ